MLHVNESYVLNISMKEMYFMRYMCKGHEIGMSYGKEKVDKSELMPYMYIMTVLTLVGLR